IIPQAERPDSPGGVTPPEAPGNRRIAGKTLRADHLPFFLPVSAPGGASGGAFLRLRRCQWPSIVSVPVTGTAPLFRYIVQVRAYYAAYDIISITQHSVRGRRALITGFPYSTT